MYKPVFSTPSYSVSRDADDAENIWRGNETLLGSEFSVLHNDV